MTLYPDKVGVDTKLYKPGPCLLFLTVGPPNIYTFHSTLHWLSILQGPECPPGCQDPHCARHCGRHFCWLCSDSSSEDLCYPCANLGTLLHPHPGVSISLCYIWRYSCPQETEGWLSAKSGRWLVCFSVSGHTCAIGHWPSEVLLAMLSTWQMCRLQSPR